MTCSFHFNLCRYTKVILVTGASGNLGKLMVEGLRAAFPAAVVYGTSRTGWYAQADNARHVV